SLVYVGDGNVTIAFVLALDGIRGASVTGVQTCALPIFPRAASMVIYDPAAGRGYITDSLANTVNFNNVDRLNVTGTDFADILREIGRASCRERGEVNVVIVAREENDTQTGGKQTGWIEH